MGPRGGVDDPVDRQPDGVLERLHGGLGRGVEAAVDGWAIGTPRGETGAEELLDREDVGAAVAPALDGPGDRGGGIGDRGGPEERQDGEDDRGEPDHAVASAARSARRGGSLPARVVVADPTRIANRVASTTAR